MFLIVVVGGTAKKKDAFAGHHFIGCKRESVRNCLILSMIFLGHIDEEFYYHTECAMGFLCNRDVVIKEPFRLHKK